MFIDAYEDSMNVNFGAGSIAGARKVNKPWPPTIEEYGETDKRDFSRRYTDEAYAEDSVAISEQYGALDGDYSDAYDPPQKEARAAASPSRALQFDSLNVSPPSVAGSVATHNTLVSENASAYTSDIDADPAYMDALHTTTRTRHMARAGEMVKSNWEYQVRPPKRRCHVDQLACQTTNRFFYLFVFTTAP